MNILLITQAVDKQNTTLGFFTRWIEEFAKNSDKVFVICLYEGEHNFNDNKKIKIYSLGKDRGLSKFQILINFFKILFKLRKEYQNVFVHMNQEYIVLAGIFWRLYRKKVFFWRNHPMGDFLTNVAVYFSFKVFATAKGAYVNRFSKTEIMPVGVDNYLFKNNSSSRKKGQILMLGRISPIKRIEAGLEIVSRLVASSFDIKLIIVGDFLPKDRVYFSFLENFVKSAKISEFVEFRKGVPFSKTSDFYNQSEFFLNFTSSGSFDKTIIEALSCGCKVLTTNSSVKDILPKYSYCIDDSESRFEAFKELMSLSGESLDKYQRESLEVSKHHSLTNLINLITLCINQKK